MTNNQTKTLVFTTLDTYNKKNDDYENINNVNPLYLIVGKADGYIEKNNGNKHLVFTSTDCNKKVLAKFTKLWDEIKYLIEKIHEVKKVSMKMISWESNLIQMIIYL